MEPNINSLIFQHAIQKKVELELDNHSGRVVQKDDVLNIQITLNSTNTVEEFLEQI